jgi:hypothetical protein
LLAGVGIINRIERTGIGTETENQTQRWRFLIRFQIPRNRNNRRNFGFYSRLTKLTRTIQNIWIVLHLYFVVLYWFMCDVLYFNCYIFLLLCLYFPYHLLLFKIEGSVAQFS